LGLIQQGAEAGTDERMIFDEESSGGHGGLTSHKTTEMTGEKPRARQDAPGAPVVTYTNDGGAVRCPLTGVFLLLIGSLWPQRAVAGSPGCPARLATRPASCPPS